MISAGAATRLPFAAQLDSTDSQSLARFDIADRPVPPDERPFARLEVVSAGFLETLGVPLVEGRAFDARDSLSSAPVALVNQEFVRRHFQGETAVGRALLTGRRTPIAIVGVVGDVKARPVALTAEPTIYFALSQSPPFRTRLVVRAQGDPQALLPMVRRVVTAIDPDLPVFEVRTLEQIAADAVATERFALCCSACSPRSRWCSA